MLIVCRFRFWSHYLIVIKKILRCRDERITVLNVSDVFIHTNESLKKHLMTMAVVFI